MTSIQQEERRQAQRLKRNIKHLIKGELQSISPWWLISFHYRDHHTKEDELLQDVADLKRKLHRIIYKSRDKTIKGAGEYPYPRMLFFHETSHHGTGQFHTHLITEKMPASLNSQYEMETLFHERLPQKVKALSKWKSIDIQRINPQDDDYKRISSYLGKQTSLELIALDPFNSDLSPKKEMRRNQLTITYPEGDAQQLHQALLLLKRSQHLKVSAFCRAAIAEKLERLEKHK